MSILPINQNNVPLHETVLNRETALPLRETRNARETEFRPSQPDAARETPPHEDKDSGFRKIFTEKKAEREKADDKKAADGEKTGKTASVAKKGVQRDVKKEKTEKKGQEKVSVRDDKKIPTLKDILAALIEKKHKSNDNTKIPEKKSEPPDKKAPAVPAERVFTLAQRLEKARKMESAPMTVKALIKKSERKQTVKTAVIVDLRETPAIKSRSSATKAKADTKKNTGQVEAVTVKKPGDQKEPVEVKMYVRHPATPDTGEYNARGRAEDTVRAKTDFSSRLTDTMKNELVRHSGIVVKDGGSGEIHLVLKPESLGSVRVRLNLEDNHIVGKIIVDNDTVKAIIKENLGDLETALQEKGYESAALNVFVAGEHQDPSDAPSDFESLVQGGGDAPTLVTQEYDKGGVNIYDDALVNIVL